MTHSSTPPTCNPPRLPPWLRVKTGKAKLCGETRALLAEHGLQTVCDQARCPNIGECYSRHTATFLIMGKHCTRDCRFCAVLHGAPEPLDPGEPARLAAAATALGLRHVVVTSVTRDDLPDGGAGHFAATIRSLRKAGLSSVEVLTPDFRGNRDALRCVLIHKPTVFNHNVETVRALCPTVRPLAGYDRSLQVLRDARELAPDVLRKSGFMVGLGETDEQVAGLMEDLFAAGCQILTIGQYLQPSPRQLPV
ncbi:MAG: lipoyl synthase, partial [Armatimonadetes bacterium]|nr:lipoyl synthase [Armatimonadota bacterium]